MQFHTIVLTPTVDTSAYSSGDQIGTLQTITGPTSGTGSGTRIEKLVIVDKAKQKAAMKIFLFDASPTVASADNDPADISDAEMASKAIGVISVAASDYADLSANSTATVNPNLVVKPTAGTNALYALMVSAGTPTYGASDLVLKLSFTWE